MIVQKQVLEINIPENTNNLKVESYNYDIPISGKYNINIIKGSYNWPAQIIELKEKDNITIYTQDNWCLINKNK